MKKRPMARLLLLRNDMTTPKILAWLMAIVILTTAALALAAPTWLAVIYNKDQKVVLMRMKPVSGATGYKVMRSETAGGGYEEIGTTKVPMYKDDTAEPGTTYYYVFLAVTPGGEEQSEEKSLSTPGRKKEKIPAPDWKNITPTVRSTLGKQEAFVGMSWKQEQAQNTIGFNIYRSETSGGDYQMITSTGPGDTSFVDNTVEVGKTYYYVISALDQNLEETPYSKEGVAEVKAPEIEKKKRRPRKLKKPIPRTTEILWRSWNEVPETEDKENRAKLRDLFDIVYNPAKDLLYIDSTYYCHIIVLQGKDGKFVKYLGPDFGGEKMGMPIGMALDKQGNLYVVDQKNSALFLLTGDGELIKKIPVGQKDEPNPPKLLDVVVLDDGRIVVTDNANGQLIVFDQSGDEIKRWGEYGIEDNQMKGIGVIQVTPDGKLAIVDGPIGKIKVFTPTEEFVMAIGERKPVVEGFQFLTGLLPLPDGQFLASDLGPHLIKQFDPKGDPRQYQADLANEDGTGRLDIISPLNMATDGKGRIFIAEGISSRVTSIKLGEILAVEE